MKNPGGLRIAGGGFVCLSPVRVKAKRGSVQDEWVGILLLKTDRGADHALISGAQLRHQGLNFENNINFYPKVGAMCLHQNLERGSAGMRSFKEGIVRELIHHFYQLLIYVDENLFIHI